MSLHGRLQDSKRGVCSSVTCIPGLGMGTLQHLPTERMTGGLRLLILGPHMSLATSIRASCGGLNLWHGLSSDRGETL